MSEPWKGTRCPDSGKSRSSVDELGQRITELTQVVICHRCRERLTARPERDATRTDSLGFEVFHEGWSVQLPEHFYRASNPSDRRYQTEDEVSF